MRSSGTCRTLVQHCELCSLISFKGTWRQSQHNIKEEDLPTVNDSVKRPWSILFPGDFLLTAALPLSLNITPDLSQTPWEHERRWRAPGKLWYFSLLVTVTCPLPHPSLRIPLLPSSIFPFVFLLQEGMKNWEGNKEREGGRKAWDWDQKHRLNMAETYFTVNSEGQTAHSVFLPATAAATHVHCGWTVTFTSSQINHKYMRNMHTWTVVNMSLMMNVTHKEETFYVVSYSKSVLVTKHFLKSCVSNLNLQLISKTVN